MKPEFSGIERRLDELNERLARLEALKAKSRSEFDADPYLRDIVERNLEVAAQCCLDICHRVISIEKALKPGDYREAFLRMSELGVLPPEFARKLSPIAGFRNILVHEYLGLDWNEVYSNLQKTSDLVRFAEYIREWLKARPTATP
ncbi:MAG: DUF86 domain-containing protein [Deltaproteobacteria bacterium]|nr:DUF86 domain-containing protein [Deltaproteobacteria bacterium]